MAYVENEKVRKKWRDERKTLENENSRVGVRNIASGRENRLEIENGIKTDEGEWGGSDGDEGESGGGGGRNGRDLVRFQQACRQIQRKTLENEDCRVGKRSIVSGREIENGIKTDEGEWGGSNGDEGESGGGGGRNGRDLERFRSTRRWLQQDKRAGHLLTLKDTSKEHKVSALPRALPEALAKFFSGRQILDQTGAGREEGRRQKHNDIRIGTLNIVSGRSNRLEMVCKKLKRYEIDLCILRETKLSGFHTVESHDFRIFATKVKNKNKGGVAMLYQRSENFHIESPKGYGDNIVKATIIHGRQRTVVLGIYIPPSESNEETMIKLDKAMKNKDSSKCII